MKMVDKNGLKISSTLFEFINNEAIPNTGVKNEDFWKKVVQRAPDTMLHLIFQNAPEDLKKNEAFRKETDKSRDSSLKEVTTTQGKEVGSQ